MKANVKKIIITSSVAAIYSGHKDFNKIFTEKEWSVPENSAPYEKSKHLAVINILVYYLILIKLFFI